MGTLNCLVNEYSYEVGCLAPAILIIAVLSFMRKRVRLKPDLWNGRPGLPVAVDFLGDERNRFIIPLAFGATAASALNLFFKSSAAFQDLPRSPWAEAFLAIFMALLYGIINYPYLACLNAEYKIIGYTMGLLYSFIRVLIDLVLYFGCTLDDQGEKALKQVNLEYVLYERILTNIPVVICILILNGSYAMLLFKEIQKLRAQDRPSLRYVLQREEQATVVKLVGKAERTHTRLLFCNQLHQAGKRESNPNDPWYTKLKNRIYVSRPDFKFSTQFLSSFVVSCIFVYQLTVLLLIVFSYLKTLLSLEHSKAPKDSRQYELLLLLPDYLITSVILAALFAVLQLGFFLIGHRNDVLKTYKTRKGLLPDETLRPKMLVGKSLRFCGYQIAFTAAGLLVNAISVFFLLLPICIFNWLSKFMTTDEMLLKIKVIVLWLLPWICTILLSWLSLILLAHFVFKDRTYPDISITINNRRLFGIMSYFFFFLNIPVGLVSCLLRIFKGAVLSLVFLPRIDRTTMMQGYRRFDRAYMAYIGFLNVLVAFRHPVMLCFTQLLLEGVRRREAGHATIAGRPRVSGKALNRWFLVILLMRNPSLVRYRKQDVFPTMRFPSSSDVQLEMPPIDLEKDSPPAERSKILDVY